jgi:hypothetical protein
MSWLLVPIQPEVLPLTVYVVFTVGQTTAAFARILPGNHVYDAAPVAVSVAQEPAQTDDTVLVMFTLGIGFTDKFKV